MSIHQTNSNPGNQGVVIVASVLFCVAVLLFWITYIGSVNHPSPASGSISVSSPSNANPATGTQGPQTTAAGHSSTGGVVPSSPAGN